MPRASATSRTTSRSRKRASRLPREQREAEILDAALLVFRKRGFERASISEIAEHAGIVEGSIYRYFTNKRDLLAKVIERWYLGLISDGEARLAALSGTRERLRYAIWHHLKVIADEPMLSWLVFSEFRPDPAYKATRIFSLNRRYTSLTSNIIKQAMASGEFRDDVPPGLVRDMIFGTIEHNTWAFLRGERNIDAERNADAIADLVLRSLARQTVQQQRRSA